MFVTQKRFLLKSTGTFVLKSESEKHVPNFKAAIYITKSSFVNVAVNNR